MNRDYIWSLPIDMLPLLAPRWITEGSSSCLSSVLMYKNNEAKKIYPELVRNVKHSKGSGDV